MLLKAEKQAVNNDGSTNLKENASTKLKKEEQEKAKEGKESAGEKPY